MKDYDKELTSLAERLTLIALEECNPANWPSANRDGTLPLSSEMTAAERGDLVWAKKSAAGTLGLLQKIHSLRGAHAATAADQSVLGASGAEADEDERRRAIKDAQKELRKLFPNGGYGGGDSSKKGQLN